MLTCRFQKSGRNRENPFVNTDMAAIKPKILHCLEARLRAALENSDILELYISLFFFLYCFIFLFPSFCRLFFIILFLIFFFYIFSFLCFLSFLLPLFSFLLVLFSSTFFIHFLSNHPVDNIDAEKNGILRRQNFDVRIEVDISTIFIGRRKSVEKSTVSARYTYIRQRQKRLVSSIRKLTQKTSKMAVPERK